ncbi:hypothetical protein MRB53_040735 [Persea americana]|nr:hypothetical protein MRB53_040735 [Persea americana]
MTWVLLQDVSLTLNAAAGEATGAADASGQQLPPRCGRARSCCWRPYNVKLGAFPQFIILRRCRQLSCNCNISNSIGSFVTTKK